MLSLQKNRRKPNSYWHQQPQHRILVIKNAFFYGQLILEACAQVSTDDGVRTRNRWWRFMTVQPPSSHCPLPNRGSNEPICYTMPLQSSWLYICVCDDIIIIGITTTISPLVILNITTGLIQAKLVSRLAMAWASWVLCGNYYIHTILVCR